MKLDGITLHPGLVKAIKELGYTEFTPIQVSAIPEVQKGRDVIGQSSTGSGKTAAFGLPILEKLEKGRGIQALILTPTRELCVQVADSLASFAKYTGLKVCAVYGGVAINPQKQALQFSEVVVGTPGRILDHMGQRTIKLGSVKFFVLDETDRMCDMGFYDDVEKIIQGVPKQRQTLLFSATYTRDVDRLVGQYLNSPVSVKAEQYVDPSLLTQIYYDVSPAEKLGVLVHLLRQNTVGLSLVFCSTRREADVVAKNLYKNGLHAMAIHGGLTQARRLKALESLKKEHIDILVATDVAARGLDIKGVSYVYNYDVPKTSDEYIHRIGRTARAGEEGKAITLLVPHDHMNFKSVLRNSSLNIKNEPTPQAEIIQMQRRMGRDYEGGGRGGPRGHGMHAGHGGGGFGGRGRQSSYGHPGHREHSRQMHHIAGPHASHPHETRPNSPRPHNEAGQASGLSNEDYRDISAGPGQRSFGRGRGGGRGGFGGGRGGFGGARGGHARQGSFRGPRSGGFRGRPHRDRGSY